MSGLIFRAPSGVVFKINDLVVEAMGRHAQHERDALEAGGLLLGRWISNMDHYVVDEISEPTCEDRRTRVSFFRSREQHQRRIHASLMRSRRTCGYLGEWHTHPEPEPRPSSVDMNDWRRHLVEDRLDIPHVFFVIVGTATTRAWMASRMEDEPRIFPLELRTGRRLCRR